MAELQTANYKTVGLLVGFALIAAIFLITTTLNSGPKEEPVTQQAYFDSKSGLVFTAPVDWTVGYGTSNRVRLRSTRLSEVATQKTQCMSFSQDTSSKIEQGTQESSSDAESAWKAQFSGLESVKLLNSSGGIRVLVGVDTCNETLTTKSLLLRGQTYLNDVELQFTIELPQDPSLSQSELRQMARDLTAGNAKNDQSTYDQFVQLIGSVKKQ